MGVPADIVPVVMLGGQVTGLRPFAAEGRPAPLLKIHGGKSIFQLTVLRGQQFGSPPVIVCPVSLRNTVRRQLSEIGVKPAVIIAEPFQRSTAAAAALAAFYLNNKEKLMLVMPSDQMVCDEGVFYEDISNCVPAAKKGVVLLGVKPRCAETSYGYIRQGIVRNGLFSSVSAFYEKPDFKEAQALCRDGHVLWNTGMFLANPSYFLHELQIYAGDIYRCVQRSYFSARVNADTIFPQDSEFDKIPAASVEHAVMEKSTTLTVCHVKIRWGDVGTWKKFLRMKVAGI
jgi:mannose-1-phosphate guanylyltransferase/mannose-6-phosphate isomerase